MPAHQIPFAKAIEMAQLYRDNRESILLPAYRGQDILALNETFEKEAVLQMLNQTGCIAMRIYYGMNDDLKVHAILVGVNASNEDMLPEGILYPVSNVIVENSGELLEESNRCPPNCPPSSPLNEP